MTRTNQQAARRPSGALTLSGELTLTDAFLTRLKEVVEEVVREILRDHLEEITKAASKQAAPKTPDIDRGIQVSEAERTAAARARTQSGVKFGLKDGQGLVDTKTLARFLDISPRTLFKMMVTHEMPTPISFGRTKRWVMEEIQAWVYAGCPGEQRWNHTKKLAIRDFRTWSTPVRP